jgi:hypothetical protein
MAFERRCATQRMAWDAREARQNLGFFVTVLAKLCNEVRSQDLLWDKLCQATVPHAWRHLCCCAVHRHGWERMRVQSLVRRCLRQKLQVPLHDGLYINFKTSPLSFSSDATATTYRTAHSSSCMSRLHTDAAVEDVRMLGCCKCKACCRHRDILQTSNTRQ